jgi:hypothetical protein
MSDPVPLKGSRPLEEEQLIDQLKAPDLRCQVRTRGLCLRTTGVMATASAYPPADRSI